MTVHTLNSGAEDPQPVEIERQMEKIGVRKNTRNKPPHLTSANLGVREERRNILACPPSDCDCDSQKSDARDHGVL
jgi:hypothetical protein